MTFHSKSQRDMAGHVGFKLIDPMAVPPRRHSKGAAGYDLCSTVATTIAIGEVVAVPTGIALSMPEWMEAQVRPRSGLASKYNVTAVLGTIDSDYRGEIRVMLQNHGKRHFHIAAGERIGQLVFHRVEHPMLVGVAELDDTHRGDGGFGSTGV